jgi:hypothetical protein
MAKTYPIGPLRVYWEDDADVSFAERQIPEAASQTFFPGAPLKWSSGAVAEWVSNADAPIMGFALTRGQNSASLPVYVTDNRDPAVVTGPLTMAKILYCLQWLLIEGNLLAAAGANYTLLATDLGASKDLIKKTGMYTQGGVLSDGWYIQNTAAAATVTVCDLITMDQSVTTNDRGAIPGDTNARVGVRVLPGKSVYF